MVYSDWTKSLPVESLRISENACGMSRPVSAAIVAERPLPEMVRPSVAIDTCTFSLRSSKV